jgi:hypothetical protein
VPGDPVRQGSARNNQLVDLGTEEAATNQRLDGGSGKPLLNKQSEIFVGSDLGYTELSAGHVEKGSMAICPYYAGILPRA